MRGPGYEDYPNKSRARNRTIEDAGLTRGLHSDTSPHQGRETFPGDAGLT